VLNRKRSIAPALTILVAVLLTALPALAGEKILHNFNVTGNGGYQPYGGLVLDKTGNLYGTTLEGGAGGVVFELKPVKTGGWTEQVLFTFAGRKWGALPYDNLILDASGNLYGTTEEAGSTGGGVVFEGRHLPDGSWKEQILCNLGENTGELPFGSLTFDAAGNLFGTAHAGGPHADGTVFELTPTDGSWTASVPHFFTGPPDGFGPKSNVIFDSAGNLYGTTLNGGAHSAGTVFELSPNGDGAWTETILHNFQRDVGDGYTPWAGLIFDAAGNLYGTTAGGGAQAGTVFELSPNGDDTWSEKILHKFGIGTDGKAPLAGLAADASGNLYGTTSTGGIYNGGNVFKLTPAANGTWTETVLHNFGNGNDGKYPSYGALAIDAAGNLYGTTIYGGKYLNGIAFEITP